MDLILMESPYFTALCRAMHLCSQRPNAVFLGQAVAVKGTTMSATFRDVPPSMRLEMPVVEDLQMGMATGMALAGHLPICVFPRWNFMLCAANQLINHLDRLPLYSDGAYKPKVIIRVAVPSTSPFNPGPQHDDDFSDAFAFMLRTVKVHKLRDAESVVPAYEYVLNGQESAIMVEYTDRYRNARASEMPEAEAA